MKLFFPYPDKDKGKTKRSKLRLVDTWDVKLEDLGPWEVVVNKDYASHQTLLASITDELFEYKGYLFEKLINLNISKELNAYVPQIDREKIMKFVEDYAVPWGAGIGLLQFPIWDGNKNLVNLNGNSLDWLFFPYNGTMSHRSVVGYFERFQAMYLDIIGIVEAIKNKDIKLLQQYEGVFSLNLPANSLRLSMNDKGSYPVQWQSSHSLALCYLELYSLIISNSNVKLCKYCQKYFESSKSNTTRCSQCSNPNTYRRLYYYSHPEDKIKAKERMRKLRSTMDTKSLLNNHNLLAIILLWVYVYAVITINYAYFI